MAALSRLRAWLRRRSTVHLIDALTRAQGDRLRAEVKAADLQRRLELRIWLDLQARKQRAELERQVSHWCQQTIRTEAALKAATEDRDEALRHIDYLQHELADTVRARDELIEISDNLRAELKLPKSGVTTTRKAAR